MSGGPDQEGVLRRGQVQRGGPRGPSARSTGTPVRPVRGGEDSDWQGAEHGKTRFGGTGVGARGGFTTEPEDRVGALGLD